MDFRSRLIATLRAVRAVLQTPGVLVIGSEVPNLRQPAAAATLVVSRDVDLGVSLSAHAAVKASLHRVAELRRSDQEPSVWVPRGPDLLEVNFVGIDPAADADDTRVLDDDDLPLVVFGALSLLRPDDPVVVEGLHVPLPRTGGLLLEKLLTDRGGPKGDRDLLVAVGLLGLADEADLVEACDAWRALAPDQRHAVRSNLSLVSLMGPAEGLPDPRPLRPRVAALLRRLEAGEGAR